MIQEVIKILIKNKFINKIEKHHNNYLIKLFNRNKMVLI
jgi:hypothetical protein